MLSRLPTPPARFRVENSVSGVRVGLPFRPSVRPNARAAGALVVTALGLCGGFTVLALVDVVSAAAGAGSPSGLMGLFVLTAICAAAARWTAFTPDSSQASSFALSDKVLRIEQATALELPLEDIREVEIWTNRYSGGLRIRTDQGVISAFEGLFLGELTWVREAIIAVTERRRGAILQAGGDPNARIRAPEELVALVVQ